MNIPKAIEILKGEPGPQFILEGKEAWEACQLGREALKWREKQKDYGYIDLDDLLPGETED